VLRPKRHDSVNRIIVKIDHNSSALMLLPRCGMLAVTFLPQVPELSADFWAGGPSPPNHRHAAAIGPPQIWPGGCCAGNQALARIDLSPVG
jgi:hypothetical protein